MGTIGRPGIGGEFLDVCEAGYGRYGFRRFRLINRQNEAPRKLGVDDLPSEAMIDDLLEVIERIVEHMDATTDYGVDFNNHGMAGDYPSFKDRLATLLARAKR